RSSSRRLAHAHALAQALESAVADHTHVALGDPEVDGDVPGLAVVVEGHDQDCALAFGQASEAAQQAGVVDVRSTGGLVDAHVLRTGREQARMASVGSL